MNRLTQLGKIRCLIVILALSLLTLLAGSLPAHAQQTGAGHQLHTANVGAPSADEVSLAEQLRQLQSKIARLEAALMQNHQATASQPAQPGAMAGRGMGMMEHGMGGMGSMQSGQRMSGMATMSQRGMGPMSGQAMPAMGMDGMSGMGMGGMGMMSMEGMQMMGQMPGMGSMQMPSALPGFPGASHIYHIGATGFFLDHPQHITLTPEQQTALNRIKEQALLEQSTFDRSIAQGEQELWVQTSSDSPDVTKIEAKVRELEKLRGEKRIAFIRTVGEAAKVLTDEQREVLVGHAAHNAAPVDSIQQ